MHVGEFIRARCVRQLSQDDLKLHTGSLYDMIRVVLDNTHSRSVRRLGSIVDQRQVYIVQYCTVGATHTQTESTRSSDYGKLGGLRSENPIHGACPQFGLFTLHNALSQEECRASFCALT